MSPLTALLPSCQSNNTANNLTRSGFPFAIQSFKDNPAELMLLALKTGRKGVFRLSLNWTFQGIQYDTLSELNCPSAQVKDHQGKVNDHY